MTDKKKKELSEEELKKASGGLNVSLNPLGSHTETSPEGAPGTFGGDTQTSGGGLDPIGDADRATPQQRSRMDPRQQP